MILMLYQTNILGYIGTEKNQINKKNKLIIWDENAQKVISELRFCENILNFKLRRDKIFIVCKCKIYIFTLETLEGIDIIKTCENINGAFGISYNYSNAIFAYPSLQKGKIQIKNDKNNNDIIINAHEKNIAIIKLTFNGNLMASATEMGTIIRIFDTKNGNLIKELRRGKEKTLIKDICFDENDVLMAASSSRGTVHIWSISDNLNEDMKIIKDNKLELSEKQENEQIKKIQNKRSILKGMSKVFGDFFNSEWSFAQVRIKDENTICCFGEDNTIIIVATSGIYYKVKIPIEKGGNCQIIQQENFII